MRAIHERGGTTEVVRGPDGGEVRVMMVFPPSWRKFNPDMPVGPWGHRSPPHWLSLRVERLVRAGMGDPPWLGFLRGTSETLVAKMGHEDGS